MIIFVAGIHGVGKTTACAAVAAQLNMQHVTASSVIKETKANGISSETKIVADVAGNQEALIQGVMKLRSVFESILLDGHMTLRTPSGLSAIAVEVFHALQIDGLILVTDDPPEIRARLEGRDGKSVELAQITEHQEAEVLHANLVAKSLQVPLATVRGPNVKAIHAAIGQFRARP